MNSMSQLLGIMIVLSDMANFAILYYCANIFKQMSTLKDTIIVEEPSEMPEIRMPKHMFDAALIYNKEVDGEWKCFVKYTFCDKFVAEYEVDDYATTFMDGQLFRFNLRGLKGYI